MAQVARDADSFYVQDCRQVQNNTHSIQTLTGQISRLVGTMEAEKDFQHCRKMVDDAVRQASETKAILARIREHQHQAQNTAERNNRRMMYQKLSDNLAITARVLEDVVRRFTAEERRRVGSSGVFEAPGIAAADVAGGNDQKPLLSTGGDQMDTALQTDKVQTLRKVDEDMLCLQRIYTDLATAAEEQASSFDTLESHMARASADIERGREEIEYTDRYNFSARLKRRLRDDACDSCDFFGADLDRCRGRRFIDPGDLIAQAVYEDFTHFLSAGAGSRQTSFSWGGESAVENLRFFDPCEEGLEMDPSCPVGTVVTDGRGQRLGCPFHCHTATQRVISNWLKRQTQRGLTLATEYAKAGYEKAVERADVAFAGRSLLDSGTPAQEAIALKQQCDRAVAADTALQQTLADLSAQYREEARFSRSPENGQAIGAWAARYGEAAQMLGKPPAEPQRSPVEQDAITLQQLRFELHDLKANGVLEEDELIKMNEKVSLLHYGKAETNKEAIREKYKGVFREHLDANGKPVPFSVFREYMQGVLNDIDTDPEGQVMMVEQFIAEAESARQAFRYPSLISASWDLSRSCLCGGFKVVFRDAAGLVAVHS
ncbi:unnamed protein product [Symbiodinium sp. CCMP2456]|nr:unnamed protein product [Symbiodinium sp. CCMP2456]